MNSQEQLLLVINKILLIHNQIRAQAEQQLEVFKEQYPNEFIVNMLLLCRSDDFKVRKFASVHIRNSLSRYTHKSHRNIWKELKNETQYHVKIALFQLLELEESQNVRSQLCDAIGEIGGSLYEEEQNNGWPELVPTIWKLFLSPKNELVECGFKVLSTLFTYALEMFNKYQNDVHTLFLQGLASPDLRIKTATIQAIGNYVTSAEPKQYKPFEELTNNLMQAALQVVVQDQNLGEDVMEVFSDIIETEHKFFRKYFNIFFNGLTAIFREPKVDQGVKRIGTDTLIVLAEKSPKLFKQNETYLTQLVEMVLYHMTQISPSVTEEWKKPVEGFNADTQQDDDYKTTIFGMGSIDRLIASIGDEEMLPIILQVVKVFFSHEDWRFFYAVIMALSQVGEFIDEVGEIKQIVNSIVPLLSDENPMIRYAVCHAIGQIASDQKILFKRTFLHVILPQFLIRLQMEDVQRVTSHLLAALTNILEGIEKEIQAYLQDLVLILVNCLKNGISLVKENAMAVMAATAESSKEKFIPYIKYIIPLLFQNFQKHQSQEYTQLQGQTIETITIIAASVGAQTYQPYIEQTVQLLLTVQEGIFERWDHRKSYVFSGWQRLALVCAKRLSTHLPRIIPSLFQLINLVFDLGGGLSKSKSGENYKKDEEFHPDDYEEGEIAIQMFSVFIEEFKESFFPYVESSIQLIAPLCKFQAEKIRKSSPKCLVSLIENVKAINRSQATQQEAKYFLSVILDAVEQEFDPKVIMVQVSCLKEIINKVDEQFLNASEVNELSEKIFNLILESQQRKAKNEKYEEEEEEEQEVDSEKLDNDEIRKKNEIQTEEDLHLEIAELIGTIFKTHKDQSFPLFKLVCSSILPRVLDPSSSTKMHQFGIFLLDDIVEHLGYSIAGATFMYCATIFARYATNCVSLVRQAAVYGIGIMAIYTPKDQYPIFGRILVNAVYDSLELDQHYNDSLRSFGHARDNSIAALGKIIKYQSESLGAQLGEALQFWLSYLPLKFDKPEAIIQHQYLAELVIQNGNLVIYGKQENIFQVFFRYIIDFKNICQCCKYKEIQSRS